jgi:hypothetical protein
MTFSRCQRLLLGLALLLFAAGAAVGTWHETRHRSAQAAGLAEGERQAAEIRREQERLARVEAELAAFERETVALRQAHALEEAGSTMKLWSNRIATLKRVVEELPAQRIPEMQLLEPIDWVRAVRTLELDTPENLRTALIALRLLARQRMATKLQEALRRYTEVSGGELPVGIEALGPFLTAPAEAALLRRYALVRAGRLGANDEILIKELPTADMILSVGLTNFSATQNHEWTDDAGPINPEVWSRSLTAAGVAFGGSAESAAPLAQILSLSTTLGPRMEKLGQEVETAMGPEYGEEMKSAMRRYMAERGGTAPATLAQFLPYLPQAEKLVQLARPMLAEFEYLRDHDGKPATDPAQLQPYLDRPLDATKALEWVKISVDGEKISWNIEFSWGTK